MYFDEAGLRQICSGLAAHVADRRGNSDDLLKLRAGVALGIRGYRVILALRPLIQEVWTSLSNDGNPRRFAVERMLRDIDDYLSSWIVPEEGSEDGGEEDGS
jgi:hypothetical protein